MQRKETAIEVKVGALVLLSLALFAGFVFLLGDFRIGEGFHVYVDFVNAGGLKPGADVRIAGLPAGSVDSIEFMGGAYDEEVDRNVFVRARLNLEEGMQAAIGEGSRLVITTLGVLGEPYIEVVNTNPPGPPVAEGTKFVGESPPRLDELLSSVYNGIRGLSALIDTIDAFFQESDLERMITEAADLADELESVLAENRESVQGTLSNLDYILEENRDAIAPILENVEYMTADFRQVGASLNRALEDGAALRSALHNLDELLEAAAEHAPETFADLESTMDSVERVFSEQEENIAQAITNVEEITGNLVSASEDAADLAEHVNAGRGTIGALLRDDEIYDDFREFIRELKRRPWRLLWRE